MNNNDFTPGYQPEKISYLRTAVKTIFFALIYHAVSWLFYVLFIGTSMDPDSVSEDVASRLAWGLFSYAAVMLVVFGIVSVVFYFKDGKRKRAYLAATSSELRGAGNVAEGVARYKKIALKESLVCSLSTGILWLLPAIFYTVSLATSGRGYGYSDAWAIEDFFIGFIGLCEPFQNAWIGLLLGMGILFLFHYFGRVYSHKIWQENRIRR
ncbi:MAG: hypothetical protein MJ192_03575 [Clostridia bacterium]|nr:hypothetical protein [Clostridia bacterium]